MIFIKWLFGLYDAVCMALRASIWIMQTSVKKKLFPGLT